MSGCPSCWQVLLPWGEVMPTVCQPAALAPLGTDLPNPTLLKKIIMPPAEQGRQSITGSRQPRSLLLCHGKP